MTATTVANYIYILYYTIVGCCQKEEDSLMRFYALNVALATGDA